MSGEATGQAIGIAERLAALGAEEHESLRVAYEREETMLALLADAATALGEARRFLAAHMAGNAARAARADVAGTEARLLKAQGLSLAQIAKRQGCDRSTVRRRLRRSQKV
jgi:DNA-directed RNA polymerase specialized sigma24 family protein